MQMLIIKYTTQLFSREDIVPVMTFSVHCFSLSIAKPTTNQPNSPVLTVLKSLILYRTISNAFVKHRFFRFPNLSHGNTNFSKNWWSFYCIMKQQRNHTSSESEYTLQWQNCWSLYAEIPITKNVFLYISWIKGRHYHNCTELPPSLCHRCRNTIQYCPCRPHWNKASVHTDLHLEHAVKSLSSGSEQTQKQADPWSPGTTHSFCLHTVITVGLPQIKAFVYALNYNCRRSGVGRKERK